MAVISSHIEEVIQTLEEVTVVVYTRAALTSQFHVYSGTCA